jgi:hypothetical protein
MRSLLFLNYFSISEKKHSFRVIRGFPVMSNHDYRGTLRDVEVRQKLNDSLFVLTVQVSRWFISQDDGRVIG